MVDFTIAIPTYNSEHRLPELMQRLRSQVGIEHLTWEIIVIDNNSTDKTAQVIRSYQQDFPVPVHYCLETQQGAGYARKHGVRVASGDLIGFLDDDNLPNPDWIAQAYAFAQSHPKAGAYGSQIHPDFEGTPPQNFERILPFFAITERGSKPLFYDPKVGLLPPSAGLVVRRQAWLDHVPQQTILSGRVQGNMLTSEDLEVLTYIQQGGWEIWYNPAMEMFHKIPCWRLEKSYLNAMFRGIGLTRHVTRMLRIQPLKRPFMVVAYMINDTRKILLHLKKYGFEVNRDPIAACELSLFVGSLVSPIYLSNKGYLKGMDVDPNLKAKSFPL
jgi:glycosyltransferase involved in cell wall biosynthesis